MTLAEHHNWRPCDVAAMDADFIDELLLQKTARHDHDLLSNKSEDKDIKASQRRRMAAIAKWRSGD